MARTVDQIKQYIYDQIALKPSLALISANPSQTSIWKDFVHCIAVEMAVLEQLQDEFRSEVQTTIDTSSYGSTQWVIEKAFEFQYDATTPQLIQLINNIPTYPVIDATKRIVSLCCVRRDATPGLLHVFVAKQSPPVKLSALEIAAMEGYYSSEGTNTANGIGIGVAGITYDVVSLDPDQVFMEATIYYKGQYSSVIQANVITAIEAYLYNLGVTGTLDTLQLTLAIKAVEGVEDINIVNLAIRADATAFGSKTYLINSSSILLIKQDSAACYAIGETTVGSTLTDKLTFTAV